MRSAAEQNAAAVAATVLEDVAVIQDSLMGYFYVGVGNCASDSEMGAAALLSILAERLEMAARSLALSKP